MTAIDAGRSARTAPNVRWDRRGWALTIAVLVLWAMVTAGVDPGEVVNRRGWGQVGEFFQAMFTPDLSPTMLSLTVREAGVTLGYALLGSALAVIIGSLGAVLLTERFWTPMHGASRSRAGWMLTRAAFAVPRSLHEVVFGLLLVNVLGLDPLVAILALGVPYGAVTAKVFAELLDDVDPTAERGLRAGGAGRLQAFVLGTVPQAFDDLLSYSFYRFECALRGAAILGIIGAGGLGFQLALSFSSLRYDEMWTLLWALIALSGIADRWSSAVRRRRTGVATEARMSTSDGPTRPGRGDRFVRWSALVATTGVPFAWWLLDVDVTTLWSPRARALAGELAKDAFPPSVGSGGWSGLIDDSLQTIALAVLALTLSFVIAGPLSFAARRPSTTPTSPASAMQVTIAWTLRLVMLIARSVPPPVWAFIVVFVLFPGLWPGAVALAIYNAGVLGRLNGEVLENADPRPPRQLVASGASRSAAVMVATVPAVAGRFTALGLYRWEVMIRDTVTVGVVGAAGLGLRLEEQTAAFDYSGIVATIAALFVATVVVDVASGAIRRTLR